MGFDKTEVPMGYNTNAYKKPEPIRYISSELLLSTTVGDTHTIIQNH